MVSRLIWKSEHTDIAIKLSVLMTCRSRQSIHDIWDDANILKSYFEWFPTLKIASMVVTDPTASTIAAVWMEDLAIWMMEHVCASQVLSVHSVKEVSYHPPPPYFSLSLKHLLPYSEMFINVELSPPPPHSSPFIVYECADKQKQRWCWWWWWWSWSWSSSWWWWYGDDRNDYNDWWW